MQVTQVHTNNTITANYQNKNNIKNTTNSINAHTGNVTVSSPFKQLPLNYKYNAQISFGEFFDPNRTVPHIDYEEYSAMTENTKVRFRKRYQTFFKDPNINTQQEMFDKNFKYMPLGNKFLMDEFIKTAQIYTKYKDQPIICLGRSPKWFLNAALWMKNGIHNYNFVAFSKYWYRPDKEEGIKLIETAFPTPKEEQAYRKYLKRIQADPKTIVDNFNKTGKRTVITDYICSGKGACSFLDILSRYAEDLGILEEFSKSIEIVGIGSLDYMEELNPYADTISEPSVPMPPKLRPYKNNIPQRFYNMNYVMFKEMLINQNTNECRSTYYPHTAWTIYNPDKFKTGLITNMKKVEEMTKTLKGHKSMSSFTPAMYDYRNLLNFRILDGLYERGLLKEEHKSKV